MTGKELAPEGGRILIYQTEGGQTKIEVRLEGETLWLSQADLAGLYQTTKQNISLHIQNVYEEGELSEGATVKEYLTVQTEGGRQISRQIKYYNLDMIISVGYRIKSGIATRFRQWATQRLREYITKGFVLDGHRNRSRLYFEMVSLLRRHRQKTPAGLAYTARKRSDFCMYHKFRGRPIPCFAWLRMPPDFLRRVQ